MKERAVSRPLFFKKYPYAKAQKQSLHLFDIRYRHLLRGDPYLLQKT